MTRKINAGGIVIEWRPIETIPIPDASKPETCEPVIVYYPAQPGTGYEDFMEFVAPGMFRDGYGSDGDELDQQRPASHWMPAPRPPHD